MATPVQAAHLGSASLIGAGTAGGVRLEEMLAAVEEDGVMGKMVLCLLAICLVIPTLVKVLI